MDSVNRGISPVGVDNVAAFRNEDDISVATPHRTGPRVSISGTWKGRGSATSVLGSRIVCLRQIDRSDAKFRRILYLMTPLSLETPRRVTLFRDPPLRRYPPTGGVLINFPRRNRLDERGNFEGHRKTRRSQCTWGPSVYVGARVLREIKKLRVVPWPRSSYALRPIQLSCFIPARISRRTMYPSSYTEGCLCLRIEWKRVGSFPWRKKFLGSSNTNIVDTNVLIWWLPKRVKEREVHRLKATFKTDGKLWNYLLLPMRWYAGRYGGEQRGKEFLGETGCLSRRKVGPFKSNRQPRGKQRTFPSGCFYFFACAQGSSSRKAIVRRVQQQPPTKIHHRENGRATSGDESSLACSLAFDFSIRFAMRQSRRVSCRLANRRRLFFMVPAWSSREMILPRTCVWLTLRNNRETLGWRCLIYGKFTLRMAVINDAGIEMSKHVFFGFEHFYFQHSYRLSS